MGIVTNIVKCFEKEEPIEPLTDDEYEEEDIVPKEKLDFTKFPEFLCPECDLVPEILSIHSDNFRIQFKCKKCGIIECDIKEYYYKIKNSSFNKKDSICEGEKCGTKNEPLFYCSECKKNLCKRCRDKTKHPPKHKNKCFPVDEKCLEHFERLTSICFECNENFCDKCKKEFHEGHKTERLEKYASEMNYFRNSIIEKNRRLYNIIKFNQLVMKASEKNKGNDFYGKSVNNISEFYGKEEKEREGIKEIDHLFRGLEKYKKIEEKSIEFLKKDFDLKLNGNEESIFLRYLTSKKLEDKGMELMSLIRFKDLTILDLSRNKIKNIDFLQTMNLPYLECLNLSHNEIENIELINIYLDSSHLKELDLQGNKIPNIKPLLEIKLKKIDILRIENNNFDPNSEEFINLKNKCDKFGGELIYQERSIERFNQKWKKIGIKINDNMKNIVISDINEGDEILRDLYLIISDLEKNNIEQLQLNNDDITDVSILTRIKWPKLEKLSLSHNNLKNIQFLNKMNMDNITQIYLDNNKINDISPLKNLQMGKLKSINLKNNDFKSDGTKIMEIIEEIRKKYKTLTIEI